MTVEHPAYDLLPAVHRIRDAEQGYPLQALLEVVEEELARLRADVDGLYDDWFIETCAEWVVPYIGALLAVPPLQPVPGSDGGRSLVANTIGYRRRTGTAEVLELVARDVTGWPARAVEYFALLAVTQHLDHVRLDTTGRGLAGTADLRDADGLAAVGTPFDAIARNADIRHIDIGRGRYNLPDVGVHLWRLVAYPVTRGDARRKAEGQWTFDPAGRDRRLFRRPDAETPDGRVGPDDVPAPLTRLGLLRALTAAARAESDDPDSVPTPPPATALPGPDPILAVRLLGRSGWDPPARLVAADLSMWTRPASGTVAVDPVLGRLTVPKEGEQPRRISVDYTYGFPGDVGAGPHDRRASLDAALRAMTKGEVTTVDWFVAVAADAVPVPGRRVPTIAAALALWDSRADLRSGQVGVIAITDSATYTENVEVVVPSGDQLVIVAATMPPLGAELDVRALAAVGVVPHVVGDIQVRAPQEATDDAQTGLVLDGLSVEGDVHVEPEALTRLVVADCTLLRDGVRSGGWITADRTSHLAVRVQRTLAAGARLGNAETLAVVDSILHAGGLAIDADDARAEVTTCTVFGETCVRILTASNTIFLGRVEVRRRQEGCVRFSYLPDCSWAPRRYQCQPTPETPGIEPAFTAMRPVDPAFAQLAATCPKEIARGADDQGEMGAYHDLQQPRRMDNLTAQLDRYLRFGLEAGFFFAT